MINRTKTQLRWIAGGKAPAKRICIVRRALSMNNLSVSRFLATSRSPSSQLLGS